MRKLLQKLFKTEEVNLTEVQSKIDKCNLEQNQLILSSCGSGKTEASFYIAKNWNKKILYVYPMKTLASSIHKRLNNYEKILNSGQNWSIQHSSDEEDKFLSEENCITTIDQVISGYLGIGIQSFIRGKNVVCSNFIFDEIQLFDPERTLKTTICMLDKLIEHGNKFVIMTATMPEILINFLADRYNMQVTITDKPSVETREVRLYYKNHIDIKEVEAFNNKQIIICNCQREQEEIYNKISQKERVILLNNKLLKNDRKNVEKQVFDLFGKESKENDKILITTQIVEAGMDISASRMYSSLCPIDNLVQREGRVCRWGGNGKLVVFNDFTSVYDKKVCNSTLEHIKSNDGIVFSWDIQKKWINEILNEFYEQQLKDLDSFELTMADGSRDDLIRKIENVNIIVSNSCNKEDFKRENVSITRNVLDSLSLSNKLYKLKRGSIVEVSKNEIYNGETILIEGNDSIYDELGFRYKKQSKCIEFPVCDGNNAIQYFDEYIEEPWISHALITKKIMRNKLLNSIFKEWTSEEIEIYSVLAGLHDLGKLNRNWQKYIGATEEALAHNIYANRNRSLIKDQRHEMISGLALSEIRNDKLKFNLLINHHGRKMPNLNLITVSEYNLTREYKKLIEEVGYKGEIKKRQLNIDIKCKKELITPIDEDWVEFVYLEGLLMESDIEAIKEYINKFKK